MSELAELILKDLTETMRKTLAPFIEKIEQTNKQYKTLVTLMNNMPEFQKIIEENMLLKEELQKQKPHELAEAKGLEAKGSVEANTVTLEITPLADTKIVAFNVTEHVKQIYETVNEEDASEIEDDAASEADEDEEAASEAGQEEEASEVAEEEEASEAGQEEEASEVEEEASEAEEEASEAEEEASEADQEEASEADQDEASEAEEEASEAEEEASEAEEEAEEEVFTVEIDGVDYYTSDDVNGIIYSVDANEEVGEKVGQFVDGEPTFL